jgi:FAD binding domain-containing protein
LYGLNWSSRFRINSRHMGTLRSGRVFFGGDAAHVHSPAGGQGMNAGIQDMINLGWKLAMVLRGAARPELLDTYESDRLPVIRQLVTMTERATKVFNSTNPIAHALVVRVAPALLSRPAVQDGAAPRLGQIAASYRRRPLAKGGGRVGRLRAGDRVPDVHLPEGRLYDLLDPSRLTLIVTGFMTGFVTGFVTGEPEHAMAAVRECAGEWVPRSPFGTSPHRASWRRIPPGCWFGPTATSRQRERPTTATGCTAGSRSG